MQALEFSTRIEGGVIRLPKEYEGYDNAYARVIILTTNSLETVSKKDRLREVMLRMGENDIFKKIDDPLAWQKKMRNDWE